MLYTPARRHEDGHRFDDLVQETAKDILRKLAAKAPEDPEAFRRWAWSFVHMEARTVRRDAQRAKIRAHKLAVFAFGVRRPTSPNTRVARGQKRELLRRHVDRLPDIYRRAVAHYLGDGSHRELAEREGITEGNARQRLSTGTRMLRERIDKERANRSSFR